MIFLDSNQNEIVAPIVATKYLPLPAPMTSGFVGRRCTWSDDDGALRQGYCLDYPDDYLEFYQFELETLAAEQTLESRIDDLRLDVQNRLLHLDKLKNTLIFQKDE